MTDMKALVKRLRHAVDDTTGFPRGIVGLRGSTRKIPVTIGEIRLVTNIMRDSLTAIERLCAVPEEVERLRERVATLEDGLRSVRLEIGPAKAYAESEGLEARPIPSAVHIKLDLIDGYARAALSPKVQDGVHD